MAASFLFQALDKVVSNFVPQSGHRSSFLQHNHFSSYENDNKKGSIAALVLGVKGEVEFSKSVSGKRSFVTEACSCKNMCA